MIKLSNTMDVVQTLDTQLLFNFSIKEETLNSIIKADIFPCINYIYHLNKFLQKEHYKREDILRHKEIFYKNKDSFSSLFLIPDIKINEGALFNNDSCLLSCFSCINLIERIIKYGKFKNNVISDENDELLTRLLLLNVVETEVDERANPDETSKEKLDLYLSIIGYNQFSNDINSSNYFRIAYLYDNYIKANNEIQNKFEKISGYSIKSYLLFLHIFFLIGSYKNSFFESNFLNDSDLAKEIKKVLNDHLLNVENEKNNITIHSYIPSPNIINNPVLEIDNKYLLINPGFLMSRIHNIFFNKIEKAINNKAIFNKKFYGPMIEAYCRNIAKTNVIRSKFPYYNFVDEFEYLVNGSTVKSSDFYIVYNDTTIIFEIKSKKRFHETTIDINTLNPQKSLNDEFKEKIINPLKQIENRLCEIKQLDKSNYPDIPLLEKIQNSVNYYYIVVSDEAIINNLSFYNTFLKNIKATYSKNIPIYLNISEFEYLMMSLYKRKKSISKVLDHYHRFYYASNFVEMIMREKKVFKFERLDIFDKHPYSEELRGVLINS